MLVFSVSINQIKETEQLVPDNLLEVTARNNLPLTSHCNNLFSDQDHANGNENGEEIEDVAYHANGGYENSDGDYVEFEQQRQVVVNVTENRDSMNQIII